MIAGENLRRQDNADKCFRPKPDVRLFLARGWTSIRAAPGAVRSIPADCREQVRTMLSSARAFLIPELEKKRKFGGVSLRVIGGVLFRGIGGVLVMYFSFPAVYLSNDLRFLF